MTSGEGAQIAEIKDVAPGKDGIGPRYIVSEAWEVPGNISDPELGDGVMDVTSSHSVSKDVS